MAVVTVLWERTQPDVLPSVSYQAARRWWRRGAKRLGQCILILRDGDL